jgi:hypothetical protein
MNNYDEMIKEIIKAYELLKTCENEVIKGELDSYISEEIGQLDLDYKQGLFNPTPEQFEVLKPILEAYAPQESEE